MSADNLYRTFIITYIISLLAGTVFIATHIANITDASSGLQAKSAHEISNSFNAIVFTPLWYASIIVTVLASLVYEVIGIRMIVKNYELDFFDKLIWVVSFLLFGFVVGFLLLTSKKFFRNGIAKESH